MSMRQVNGDVALSGTRTAGTHQSAPIDTGSGVGDVLVMTHVTVASGTSPTLIVSVEQSADGASWAGVTGGTAATLTAAGSGFCNVQVSQKFVRVVATVAGTTPSFTFRTAVLVFAE